MNPEHKRIVDMAAGWEDSDAVLTVSPGDALTLQAVGAPVQPGKRAIDPPSVNARDLCAAAEKLSRGFVPTPEGGQPTPNQQSVTTGPVTPPNGQGGPVKPEEGEGDKLEELTVAELRHLAGDRGITLPSNANKAQIVDAIRKAPK